MVEINSINVSPPLINSSCAWSSDFKQLQELYISPHTGAVTTRTATLDGFKEDVSHTVAFTRSTLSSINSYGYSPHPLESYLSWIETLSTSHPRRGFTKPFIISVTSSEPATLQLMVKRIQCLRAKLSDASSQHSAIAIELNTSCPNIPNEPPAGYAFHSLMPLLNVLKDEYAIDQSLTIGLKLPPFVHRGQFLEVLNGILSVCVSLEGSIRNNCPFSFLTCTNTLGNTLLFPEQLNHETSGPETGMFAVPTALGGLAGESLHALALGNIYTFHQLLQDHKYHDLKGIIIIGVGGVTTLEATKRMKRAGAKVVGCATLFGKEGVRAFEMLQSS